MQTNLKGRETETQTVNKLQTAGAVTRNHRQVTVTKGTYSLIIGFFWVEWAGNTCLGMKDTSFDYPLDMDLESVLKAVSVFMGGSVKLFVDSNLMTVASRELDDMPEKFDMIADSEEPSQAFISRYIL